MSLAERLTELVRACFTGLWVRSGEHDDAVGRSPGSARSRGGPWPPGTSTAAWRRPARTKSPARGRPAGRHPGARRPWPRPSGTAMLVLRNFHRFLSYVEVVQALDAAVQGRQAGADVRRRPGAGRADPGRAGAAVRRRSSTTCRAVSSSRRSPAASPPSRASCPTGTGSSAVLDAAAGPDPASRRRTPSACRWCGTAGSCPEVLWELKAGMLKKAGLLALHRGGETFARPRGPGGAEGVLHAGAAGRGGRTGCGPRGVLLLGVPGTGKSAIRQGAGQRDRAADAGARRRRADRARSWARPSANVRQALRAVDAMAPCIVFVDEIEKAPGAAQPAARRATRAWRRGSSAALLDLAQRPRERRVLHRHVPTTSQAPAGVRAGRAAGRHVLPRPARAAGEKEAIWRMYLDAVRPRPGPAQAPRPRLDRRRDQGLLPAGGAARRAAGRGGARTSCRWPSRPASRSSGCGSGPPGRCLDADAARPLPPRGEATSRRPAATSARDPSGN